MKMRATQGVSFPRSGHAAVYHIAKRYFGDALVYCDPFAIEFCGCRQIPCVNPDRTFAKNHDFGVKKTSGVPIIPTERYLIQYRNPVRSVVSNFYLHRIHQPEDDSRGAWENWAHVNIRFWGRFIDKWVLDFPATATAPLYCTYEAMLADPQARLREILSFMSDGPLDDEAAARAIERKQISPRNRLGEFEYYDEGFFRELEDAVSKQLRNLDLPSFGEEL